MAGLPGSVSVARAASVQIGIEAELFKRFVVFCSRSDERQTLGATPIRGSAIAGGVNRFV